MPSFDTRKGYRHGMFGLNGNITCRKYLAFCRVTMRQRLTYETIGLRKSLKLM